MRAQTTVTEQPSFWQLVFMQSKVNGATYHGDKLMGHSWAWPKDTFLQRRLKVVRGKPFPPSAFN